MKGSYKVLLLIIITLILVQINPSFGNLMIETQVGPFNLAGPPLVESKLVSQFGEGYVQIDKFGEKILRKKHIFWVPEQNVWVQIDLSHVLNEKIESVVEAVLVTRKRLCDQDIKYTSQKTLAPLGTARGITIGDRIDKVIERYGEPTVLVTLGKDKTFSVLNEKLKLREGSVLRYLQRPGSTQLNFAEFYFKNERLHSFLISEAE